MRHAQIFVVKLVTVTDQVNYSKFLKPFSNRESDHVASFGSHLEDVGRAHVDLGDDDEDGDGEGQGEAEMLLGHPNDAGVGSHHQHALNNEINCGCFI